MRSAVVTGGTRGIGLGIAKCLARDGYTHLLLCYSSNHDRALEVKEALQKEFPGLAVELYSGDVAHPDTAAAIFDVVAKKFKNELHCFVHNAGLYVGVTSEADSAPKDPSDHIELYNYYQKVYVVFFKKAVELAVANCIGLQSVVSISSPGCNLMDRPRVTYEFPGQAKAGMEFLTRMFALKYGKKGVRFNCVVPGYINTDAWTKVLSGRPEVAKMTEESACAVPAGRFGRPEDVGNLVAFLSSPGASFITGTTIPCDGGLSLK